MSQAVPGHPSCSSGRSTSETQPQAPSSFSLLSGKKLVVRPSPSAAVDPTAQAVARDLALKEVTDKGVQEATVWLAYRYLPADRAGQRREASRLDDLLEGEVHISPRTVAFLRTLGHEVVRVDAILPKTASDEEIVVAARDSGRSVRTQDLDFSAPARPWLRAVLPHAGLALEDSPVDQVVGAVLVGAWSARAEPRSHPWFANCSQAMATWSAGNIRRLRSFQE